MTKRHTESLWLAFLFTFIISVMLSGSAQAQAELEDQGPPEPPVVVSHDETGYASFISAGELDELELPEVMGRSVRPGQLAFVYLEAYGSYFGLRDARTELELLSQDLTPQNNNFRYQQVFRGVPVMAGELIVNTSADGGLRSMSGELAPELGLDVKPAVLPEAAAQTALGVIAKDQNVPLESLEATEPELWIYDEQLLRPSERPAELVWRMDVVSTAGAPIRELVLINAHTGGVSLHFNQIDTLWHDLAEQQEDVPEPMPTPEPTEEPAAEPTVEPTQEPTAGSTPEPELDTVPQAVGSTWYVATTGDDLNDCATPTTPCATIQAAVDMAASGDTVLIAGGTYTGAGDAVVSITTSISVIGGWDATFTSQSEVTVIDGENARRGVYAYVPMSLGETYISRLWVKRGYATQEGGGIRVSAVGTVENVTVSDSYAVGHGGGILLATALNGTLTLNNATISGNHSGGGGGGIAVYRTSSGYKVNIYHGTIVNNTADKTGGGIFDVTDISGTHVSNSIVYHNVANNEDNAQMSGQSCDLSYPSGTTNIIEYSEGCQFYSSYHPTIYGLGPILEDLDPILGVHKPYDESPAIDAAAEYTCLPTDALGTVRPYDGDGDGTSACDIGAVEAVNPQATPPRVPSRLTIFDGDNQRRRINAPYYERLRVYVQDQYDAPFTGGEVIFTSPAVGAGVTFNGSNSVSAFSDENAVATAPFMFANGSVGSFQIEAVLSGGSESVFFDIENFEPGVTYVSPLGSDSNDCLTPATPCKTFDAAQLAGTIDGLVMAAQGVYTVDSENITPIMRIFRASEISGGWSLDFQDQVGFSIIDGQGKQPTGDVSRTSVILDHIWITNTYGVGDRAGGLTPGSGTLYFINSAITNTRGNVGGGIRIESPYNRDGKLILINSTIANNHTTSSGGAISIEDRVTVKLINSTIFGNSAETGTGGIDIMGDYVYMAKLEIENTILAGNVVNGVENNCSFDHKAKIFSWDNSLFGDISTCSTLVPQANDQINTDPQLVNGINTLGFYPLKETSPAIDAGSESCFPVDVRHHPRPVDGDNDTQNFCDVGAFEFSGPDTAAARIVNSGETFYPVHLGETITTPFNVIALGPNYSIVPGAEVFFSAPNSGPSGTFLDSGMNETRVIANSEGLAVSPDYTANDQEGDYDVIAYVPGGLTDSNLHIENWQNHTWYVSTQGDNNNYCLTPDLPCKDISVVPDKTFFREDDLILVAEGEYSSTDSRFLLARIGYSISGGWNENFTQQIGYSTIQGKGQSPILISLWIASPRVIRDFKLDHFILDNTYIEGFDFNLYLTNTIIRNNLGGAVFLDNFENVSFDKVFITNINSETLTDPRVIYLNNGGSVSITNSVFYKNKGPSFTPSRGGSVLIENTIFTENHSSFSVGALDLSDSLGTVKLNNVTITNNSGVTGGLYRSLSYKVLVQNTILWGNTGSNNDDCNKPVASLGYNVFGSLGECISSPAVGDQYGLALSFGPIDYYGGEVPSLPVLGESPAIDGGNPANPGSEAGACALADIRGIDRPLDGNLDTTASCDIGAVEYIGSGSVPAYLIDPGNDKFITKGGVTSNTLRAYVLDESGTGVDGVSVTLSVPTSGPSGTFNDSGSQSITVLTDQYGLADAGLFTSDGTQGFMTISVTAVPEVDDISFEIYVLPEIKTFTMNNDNKLENLPGTFRCDLSMPGCTNGADSHADYAQLYAYETIKYLMLNHHRNSLDNAGMEVVSSVHFDSWYNNAFWNGEQMVYGDGKAYPAADDVVAHEMTHGVTEHESNLFYYYQSGAINESLSDLWGEFFDLSTPSGYDNTSSRWLVGELIGAIRSMKDPTIYSDPDKMTSPYYYREPGDYYYTDNGGVHTNSGVNNKAVYLMTDGDSFNGYTVTGIGMDKVAAIYYEVNTHLLTSGADYKDLYYAVQQACKTLTGGAEGITAADCAEVQKALDAVEMSLSPVANFNPDPPACAVGFEPNDVFYDGFETDSGKWNFQNIAGIGKTWERITGAAANGNYALYGADYQGADVGAQGLATWVYTNNIAIPAGTIFLHFEHMFGFENYINNPQYGWDGGQLQYSVNGGGWQDAKGLFAAGVNYNGTVSADYGSQNPIRNQQAFIKDSHGYVASKYNLSSFAGKNLRFRWLIGTDLGYFDVGWMLDEVRVYKCVEQQYALFTAPGNSGHILQPRAWLKVAPTANAGQVVSVEFHAKYGGTWHHLHTDTDGSDGWGYQWATWNLPDGLVDLQAKVNNSDAQTYTIQKVGLALTTTQNVGNVGVTRGGGEPEELGEPVEVGAVPEAILPKENVSFTWWRTELSWLKLMY